MGVIQRAHGFPGDLGNFREGGGRFKADEPKGNSFPVAPRQIQQRRQDHLQIRGVTGTPHVSNDQGNIPANLRGTHRPDGVIQHIGQHKNAVMERAQIFRQRPGADGHGIRLKNSIQHGEQSLRVIPLHAVGMMFGQGKQQVVQFKDDRLSHRFGALNHLPAGMHTAGKIALYHHHVGLLHALRPNHLCFRAVEQQHPGTLDWPHKAQTGERAAPGIGGVGYNTHGLYLIILHGQIAYSNSELTLLPGCPQANVPPSIRQFPGVRRFRLQRSSRFAGFSTTGRTSRLVSPPCSPATRPRCARRRDRPRRD